MFCYLFRTNVPSMPDELNYFMRWEIVYFVRDQLCWHSQLFRITNVVVWIPSL
jgi:hypothetical protein